MDLPVSNGTYDDRTVGRFLRKTEMDGHGCLLWTACLDSGGYGIFRISSTRVANAHRVSHEMFTGPIPPGEWILHSCDVRRCVNPAHLRTGSARENTADMCRRGRQAKRKQ